MHQSNVHLIHLSRETPIKRNTEKSPAGLWAKPFTAETEIGIEAMSPFMMLKVLL